METMQYSVQASDRAAFMAVMREVKEVRGRSGAEFWQLYEDVAQPERWLEIWSMESWTDHLRESMRLSDDDRAILARSAVFQRQTTRPGRFLAVDPQHDDAPGSSPARVGRPDMGVSPHAVVTVRP